jgi:hypothetical protein
MSHRISRAILWLVPILVVTLFPLRASGQESAATEAREEKAEHRSQSVTGCLQKGAEASGFVLRSEDGKTWELMSGGSVQLADHVGHKVTVTGAPTHESKTQEEKMEKDEKKEADGKVYGDLTVDKVEMVSNSCN